jgi:methylmalonyl-CoA/ethylmalonyl-CoA epimerase
MREVGAALGGSFVQIGVIVEDLERAVAGAEALGALGTFRSYPMESASFGELTHRGRPAEVSMMVALNRSTPQVEYIQPTSGESVYSEFLAAHGPGIHHLGFQVEDIDAATARMAEAGFDPVFHGRGYGRGGDGAFAYFDTSAALGFWVEAILPPAP